MTTEELVRALSADLTPVRRLAGVGRRTLCLVAGSLLCTVVILATLRVHAASIVRLAPAAFLREQLALLLTFAWCAWRAIELSVPGRGGSSLARILPVLGLVLWVGLVLARHPDQHELASPGLRCVWRMMGLGLVPLAMFGRGLRRELAVERQRSLAYALVSACTLGMFGAQWLCLRFSAAHVLVWHCGPVLLASAVAFVVGARSDLPRAT